MSSHESEQTVTDLQPLRHETDSFFDFDCELESPGSPVDECEYLRLIETASNTPHTSGPESGYVCASAASSQGSNDGTYYDVEGSEKLRNKIKSRKTLPAAELPQYVNSLKLNGNATIGERLSNGHNHEDYDTEECETDHSIIDAKHTDQLMAKSLPTTETAAEKKPCEEYEEELVASEMIRVQDEIITELQKQSEQITESNTALTILSQPEDDTELMTPTNFVDVEMPVEQANEINEDTSDDKVLNDTIVSNEEAEAVNDNIVVENVIPTEISNTSETESAAIKTPSVTHTITNGHSEDEDEVLKIETTELVSPTQQEKDVVDHAGCIESQTKQYVENEETTLQNESPESPTEETKKLTVEVGKKESSSVHHSVIDTTDDEDDCRPQRVRRCSSLKTGKTPPGTPGRKKIVRFADVLGLDLADVKTFLDEIPTIPRSAFEDLEIMDLDPPMQLGPKSDKLLMPLFQQPGGLTTFLDLVREKQVSLENAAITDPINQLITGSVRVRNLDFHKSVHIRYTLDGWRSYADLQANYVQNSCDGFSDKYSFVLFGNSLQMGQRLEFAVRFQCKGQQFWDNNYGTNYCFQCLPTSTSSIQTIQPIVPSHHTGCTTVGQLSPNVGDTWCSSFY